VDRFGNATAPFSLVGPDFTLNGGGASGAFSLSPSRPVDPESLHRFGYGNDFRGTLPIGGVAYPQFGSNNPGDPGGFL